MGLAGPRNRTKIGVDPRNTNWSNNTGRFGHRILTTLGWQPGNALGDTSSLYHQSGHITAASTTGVKIALKDDNLGIGCNKRQREDECVGLDGFQDLLGRLNGKNEYELEKEAETRDRMRRETIVGERYGMRFVRAETYVSSDIEALTKKTKGEKKEEREKDIVVKGGRKGKGRKGKKRKKENKNSGAEDFDEIATIPATPSDVDSSVSAKKGKRQKIKRDKSLLKPVSTTPVSSDNSSSRSKKQKWTDQEDIGRSTNGKKDKKSKNGETYEQREERRAREKKARKVEKEKKKRDLSLHSEDASEDESTLAASGTTTPSSNATLVGRQAVRHRYIAAKRSSVMDAKALNEIFMIKG